MRCEHLTQQLGIATGGGLGHDLSRYDTILIEVVGDPRELATVIDGVLEEPLYLRIVYRELARLDDPFEEEVRLLELVPEEGVVLREEEHAGLLASHQLSAQDIEPREEPAASALLLVGDTGALYLDGELIFDRAWALIVDEEVLHPLYGDGVVECLLGRGLRLTLTKLLEELGGDSTILRSLSVQCGRRTAEAEKKGIMKSLGLIS